MVTKGSVLVVDDEINLCRILGAKLAKSGYNVVAVHDGLQAVEKVKESEFDLVLLDLILPKMDGLTTLAEIRRMRSALPVIVMTACESAEAVAQAKTHGVSAYVNKPFDLDSLVTLVKDTTQTASAGRGKHFPNSTVLFTRDQPVTLEVPNGVHPKVFYSQIVDKDDHTLSVLAPRKGEKPLEVAPRTCVKVGLAARDAYYSFNSVVLRSDDTPERTLVLDKPSVIYRVQRREHTRHALRLPLRYAVCSADSDAGTQFKSGETRDISLGGASILVPEDIMPGEMISIEIRPKTLSDQINAIAKVLRSLPSEDPKAYGHILGCRFTEVDDKIRKLLES